MEQGGKPRGGQLVGQEEEGGGGEGEEEKKSGALRGLAGRRTDHAGLGSRRYQVSLALEPLTLFDPVEGGGTANICIFLNEKFLQTTISWEISD